MIDDPDDVARVRRTILRIAQVLGRPVSTFYGCDADRAAMDGLAGIDEATLLTLVRAYLREADAEARGRFAAAVRAMADEVVRAK